ncbi:DNA polymerase III subunit beta [Sporanaerobium hydrogeniformans]|uniref:DNA polymerase III subunit beta n=1 Tax=Sporanaerobium hydrogeniformans TaxID=3072179 RepID=A0AC61DCJ3_9FIRM|nr:DNA polymerase III subunit beta [Sporanaerobium hydrogeniformans]PHV70625.1 DNA polymerase III subunit beta [Sporanaerobium hydrogeniformans]
MHINCRQDLLLTSINNVLKACSTKTTLPILECILLQAHGGKLTLTGNNLELGIESTIDAEVTEEGFVALEARIFSEIIRKMPGEMIEISCDDTYMTKIISEKSKFQIAGQSGKDFPELPAVQKLHSCRIKQLTLKDMIRQTIFSVAQDETRPILTGEMLQIKEGRLNIVSVDGYRISYRETPLSNENESIEVVIPGKTLTEINKILSSEETEELNIYFGDKHVLFDLGDSKVVSRLLEGEFLKYEQVFSSDYETKILIDRKNFLMCIERAALISREGKKNPIKIQIDGDKMIITSNTELGTAREEIDVILEGKELIIAFNPRYLIDALKVIDEDKVYINFISSLTPCIIKPQEGEHYKYLILPIRVNA